MSSDKNRKPAAQNESEQPSPTQTSSLLSQAGYAAAITIGSASTFFLGKWLWNKWKQRSNLASAFGVGYAGGAWTAVDGDEQPLYDVNGLTLLESIDKEECGFMFQENGIVANR